MKNTYSVYFRTGGTENFKWNWVLDLFSSREEAAAQASELARMGYPAHYGKTAEVRSVGLPETFE